MNLREKVEIHDFFDILYKYVCISGNYNRVKSEIGIRKAVILKNFLKSYLESTQEDVISFAESYLEKYNNELF